MNMQCRALNAIVLVVFFTAGVMAQSAGQDWPQWRGPNRDGAVIQFVPPSSWPEALTRQWQVEVGEGYASPVIAGDRVFVHTRRGDEEVVSALDATTGALVWQEAYPAPYELHPAAVQHGLGPKSTPATGDGKLFTFGISGILSSFDLATGRLLWRRDAPAVGPYYGTAMSPVVEGDLLIAHVGGHDQGALTAFEAASGEARWSWSGDGPSYGSPVVSELGGVRQVVTYTQSYLVGIAVASGELLWQVPFTTPSVQNTVTPIVAGDVVISSGLAKGLSALRVEREDDVWTTETIWENRSVSFYMSSPVLVGGAIYGLSDRNSGQYVCVDVATGETLWMSEGRQAANAAVVRAGELLLLLNNAAELFILETSRRGFEPLRRYDVADSQTWAHPAIVGDSLFVKDESTLARWTLR